MTNKEAFTHWYNAHLLENGKAPSAESCWEQMEEPRLLLQALFVVLGNARSQILDVLNNKGEI